MRRSMRLRHCLALTPELMARLERIRQAGPVEATISETMRYAIDRGCDTLEKSMVGQGQEEAKTTMEKAA